MPEEMHGEEFRRAGRDVIEHIIKYTLGVKDMRVTPDLNPSHVMNSLPKQAPDSGEKWEEIMHDMDTKILPGMTHWIHPHFYGYYPSGRSFPSIFGDALASALGGHGFSWSANPAQTELEMVVLDWFAKALGLPNEFLHSTKKKMGGGCFQPSESDAILVAMMAARHAATQFLREDRLDRSLSSVRKNRHADDLDVDCAALQKIIAYTSREAHTCVEKAAKICLIQLRVLPTDNEHRLRGDALRKAMEQDEHNGLMPCFVCATLGTQTTCAFDNLHEIAMECRRKTAVWLHVDATYAGNALICPEMRHLADGLDRANSINVSADKWLPVNFDCACLWVRDYFQLVEAFSTHPLQTQQERDNPVLDFRHWGLPRERRFRALKLWFTFRKFGIAALQDRIRNHCSLAKQFEDLLRGDGRFRVMDSAKMGVVCFRLESLGFPIECHQNHLTELLLAYLNASGRMWVTPVEVDDLLAIRLCVGSSLTKEEDIEHTWHRVVDSVFRIEASTWTEKVPELHVSRADREQQLSLLRYLNGTVTAPPMRYRRLQAAQLLRDPYGPFLVPDSDDRIADIFDLSDLAKAYSRV
ncbi:aromatic-L-amino-acid decarboxylase-like [Schistocerca serialis cubense]|uniref:aromatic-L-amino-acid decarboxylase-like n=1 Tax=Schistocerca serialis cubense TaxID=2023355 RepID=UPI00214EC675|nr:aromatic-L-amino-acid decarboxylase-like [Schistocerca serialis cubense]